MFNTEEFWDNLKLINPYPSLSKLCEMTGISYKNTVQQIQKGYMPKPETLLKFSDGIGVTINTLLDGRKGSQYKPEVEEIAKWLQVFGTDEDFRCIRYMLRMPGKNNRISKAE